MVDVVCRSLIRVVAAGVLVARGFLAKFFLTMGFLAMGFLAVGFSASAQSPQRTTAAYEDWVERCEIHAGSPAQKTCEISQVYQVQGQPNPFMQTAIGRASKTEPLRLVIGAPVNVWLPAGVKLVYADKDPPVEATFTRCLQGSCFAEADIKEDLIRKLRGLSENGKIQFKDAAQRDVVVPISFKGIGPAFDALAKE